MKPPPFKNKLPSFIRLKTLLKKMLMNIELIFEGNKTFKLTSARFF